MLAALEDIEDDEAPGFDLKGGLLPEDWHLNRRIGESRLEPALRFVDFESPETLKGLRRILAPVLAGLGVEDLDFSDLIGRDRRLTQRVAEHIYNAADATGEPAFCGIRYSSRLNRNWELWAIFADRMLHSPENLYQTIPSDVPICSARRKCWTSRYAKRVPNRPRQRGRVLRNKRAIALPVPIPCTRTGRSVP